MIVHVPHASRVIPDGARASIVLDDAALDAELDVMTDAFTDVLVAKATADLGPGVEVVEAPVSRLAVDVERFPDEREAMNAVGMGAVYVRTHDGSVLREAGDPRLVRTYGDPHARAVSDAVARELDARGSVVLLDIHSYPSRQQPYEMVPEGSHRPEICLGVDDDHTPSELVDLARTAFSDYEVAINTPFAGTYVPLAFYGRDRRVTSLMVEIRRDVYMDEARVELHGGAERLVEVLRRLMVSVRDAALSQPASEEALSVTEMTAPALTDLPEWAQRFLNEQMTLQELGDVLGITREGARQRLKKLGLPSHGIASVAARKSAAADVERRARLDAAESRSPGLRAVLESLSHSSFTKDAAVARLAVFFPDVDGDDVVALAERWGVEFANKNHGESIFSDASLEGALLYLLGSQLGLQPEVAWSAVHLPDPVVTDVAEALQAQGVTGRDISTVLGIIGAARRASAEAPITITGKQYEALRGELLEALGLVSAKGAMLWPPTRQTFSGRFEGWNEALTSFGLATSKKGRPKGLLRFSVEDYTEAARGYLAVAEGSGVSSTFRGYEEWVQSERDSGTVRPSGASLRQFFGSWHDVKLAAARDFVGVKQVRAAGSSIYAAEDYLEALRSFLDSAERSGTPPQYLAYQDWVQAEDGDGRRRPSAGAVQKFFGSWSEGLRVARKGAALAATSPVFHLVHEPRGVSARAQLVDGRFTVLTGSRVATGWRGRESESGQQVSERYERLRGELVAAGALDENVFVRDAGFDSTSLALLVVLGRGGGGRAEWVDADGVSYGEWEEAVEVGPPGGADVVDLT